MPHDKLRPLHARRRTGGFHLQFLAWVPLSGTVSSPKVNKVTPTTTCYLGSLWLLETYQMATRGQVLCQGLTQGLTNLGFPWLSQAEQWHVPRGTWQTRVPRGSCYSE